MTGITAEFGPMRDRWCFPGDYSGHVVNPMQVRVAHEKYQDF